MEPPLRHLSQPPHLQLARTIKHYFMQLQSPNLLMEPHQRTLLLSSPPEPAVIMS